MPRRLLIVCRTLLVLAGVLLLVAGLTFSSGGFGSSFGGIRISSRDPLRPFTAALVCAGVAMLLYLRIGGVAAIREELRRLRSTASRFLPPGWHKDPILGLTAIAIAIDIAQWWRGAPLWLDEQMIAINVRDRSFLGLADTLWLGQSAPLGWLWLERTVLLVAGEGERTLRIVPIAFGIGTIITAAWIAKRWLSPIAGVVFVALCWLGAIMNDYRFELKHYSADCFWALLLPALAVWTIVAKTSEARSRRQLGWAVAAGIGLWTSYGGLFVAPGCLLWLFISHVRGRRNPSDFVRFMVAAFTWLALFAAHYTLSLRYTHENAFLRQYWHNRVPPASADVIDRIAWLGVQLPALGREAGGTQWPIMLFVVAIGGLLIARDRRIGLVYATVPLAAVALATMRLVPVFERFSLWVVPALYLGVALALDRGVDWLRGAFVARRALPVLAGLLTCAAALPLAADVVKRGWQRTDLSGRAEINRGTDDRRGVAWLMQQRQAGDAIVTTRLGAPAIWWYGGISLRDHSDGRLDDGSRMYQLWYGAHRQRCGDVRDLLQQHRRVLIYISFPDLDADVIARLDRDVLPLGSLAGRHDVTSETRAIVLKIEPGGSYAGNSEAGLAPGITPVLDGCLELQPAVRW